MARHADSGRAPFLSSLGALLAPFPGRLDFAARLALICALTVLVVEIYQTPDPALTAYSMIDRTKPIRGVVQGVGFGVLDTDRINLPRSLPYVDRSLNWVRVAQRFPVRVRLEHPPDELVRLGVTAVVEVKHGEACG